MPDRLQSFKVICRGGLNADENHLELAEEQPGAATRLINFEPSLFGGYRRMQGYHYYDSFAPTVGDETSEGPVLCAFMYRNEHLGNPYVIAARKDVDENTYSLWRHIPLVGWEKLNVGFPLTFSSATRQVHRVRFVQFDIGLGSFIAFADGINPAYGFDGEDFYQINVSGTGTDTNPGGDQCLDAPSLVDFFYNTLFIGGDNTFRSVVAYSAPNNPLNFTAAAGAGQIPVGFNVVQFKPFRENLFVFGVNGIKRIRTDFSAGFLIESVTANVGCIARDSVVEVAGDLVFLAPDGLRPVAGTSRIGDVELETISKQVQGRLLNLIQSSNLDFLVATVVRSKSQVRYFFSDPDVGRQSSEGLIGGLTVRAGDIGWEYSETVGIRASCTSSEYVGKEEFVLHGDYDGSLFRQEVGNTFVGNPIPAIFSTPYLDFGETEVRKVLHKMNVFVRPEGPVRMFMSLRYDWGDSDISSPASYIQETLGGPTIYGGRGITYGGPTSTYGGSTKPALLSDIQGSCFSARATFVVTEESMPFSIQGIVFEFSAAGRR
jgi:hypothetical protein